LSRFVVDSSVLVAILNDEREADDLKGIILRRNWLIGWPNVFETRIWTHRHNPDGGMMFLDFLIDHPEVATVPFDGPLETLASQAFVTFGKGRHPAALNFGDCMAYAVARHLDVPLLFKGGDFGKTDVKVHPASVMVDRPR
jgi:ribonuclease VapC